MELDLLHIFVAFGVGLLVGVLAMLVFNKLKSGSASPASIKQDFDDYKNDVEAHFEETSKKFKNMTDQYQDLYAHLSVGATSLCRPDSAAATLGEGDIAAPKQIESQAETPSQDKQEPQEPETVDETNRSEQASEEKGPTTSNEGSSVKKEPESDLGQDAEDKLETGDSKNDAKA